MRACVFLRSPIGMARQRKCMWVEVDPPPGLTTPIDGTICATPSIPLNSLRSCSPFSVVPASDVPSGMSRWIVHSPMSSTGTNSRPTIRFNGNIIRKVTTDAPMIIAG